jgi:hypothetical protein
MIMVSRGKFQAFYKKWIHFDLNQVRIIIFKVLRRIKKAPPRADPKNGGCRLRQCERIPAPDQTRR